MFVGRIEIHNFRNFIHQKTELSPGVNIFLGENGQGKTNFVEAIHCVCRGQSFRPGGWKALVRSPAERAQSQLKAELKNNALQYTIGIRFDQESRSVTVNEKKSSAASLAKKFPLVLFSPDSLNAIKDGPEVRRTLLDDLLATHTPMSVELVREFQHCLKSRNRLLSDHLKGKYATQQVHDLLDSIDGRYWRSATDLTLARVKALREIYPDFSESLRRTVGSSNVDISVDYLVSGERVLDFESEQLSDLLLKRMSELRPRELASGSSLVGPHKHDVQFLIGGRDSRIYCSQGQQRALILSFKMAQIMYHYRVYEQYPILILDDVLSELDQEKRSNLIEFLQQINSQIFLTTTEIADPRAFSNSAGPAVFEVSHGNIRGL